MHHPDSAARNPLAMASLAVAILFISAIAIAQQQQGIVVPNNLFTQAGFVVKYATTPEKAAILRSLPPDKIVTRTKDGRRYYVYADAAGCNCAYVGTPEAYAAYQNWTNIGPGGNGGSLNAMQTIDSDVGPGYIPDNSIYPSMDSILQPDF